MSIGIEPLFESVFVADVVALTLSLYFLFHEVAIAPDGLSEKSQGLCPPLMILPLDFSCFGTLAFLRYRGFSRSGRLISPK